MKKLIALHIDLVVKIATGARKCASGCAIARGEQYLVLADGRRGPSYCGNCCCRWGSAAVAAEN